MSRRWVILVALIGLVLGGLLVGLLSGCQALAPARAPLHFPWKLLAEEADAMNDCVECHEPEDFHTCTTCHDDHGSAEMANIPFNDLLLLAGDVPEPGYIAINDILPYRDQPNTHVSLLDFLAEQGAAEFESVTMASRDGGFVTVDRSNLTGEALLMPHVEGMRFAAEDLHVSTWLKGVWTLIVVGPEKPLLVEGEPTSIGRLLLGPTRLVTVEQTDVMLKSEVDGQVRRGKTASRVEGVPIDVLIKPGAEGLTVRNGKGQEVALTAEEAQGAVLAQLGKDVVLVLPQRGRSQWVSGVVEIRSAGGGD